MALNPPLIPGQGLPLPVHGELFILQRSDVRFEAEVVGQTKRTYDHKGNLYLSTLRMVFVKDSNDTVNRGWFGLGPEHASDLIAYDIPLSLLHKERFNQPIFGCNNIEAVCLPLPGTDGETHVKLSFYSGGVGTFLPLFFDLLNRNRHPSGAMDENFRVAVSSGQFMRAAYIDPNDPSMIFVSSQPATPQSNSLSRDDYYRLGPQAAVAPPRVQPEPEPRAPVIIPTVTLMSLPTSLLTILSPRLRRSMRNAPRIPALPLPPFLTVGRLYHLPSRAVRNRSVALVHRGRAGGSSGNKDNSNGRGRRDLQSLELRTDILGSPFVLLKRSTVDKTELRR